VGRQARQPHREDRGHAQRPGIHQKERYGVEEKRFIN
jgi:hypothetical protein